MKTNTHSRRWLIAAAVRVGGSAAAAADPHSVTPPVPSGGHQLSMSRFYTGPVSDRHVQAQAGVSALRPGARAGRSGAVPEEGHRHALSMEDGSMIHPLLAGTDKMLKQINSSQLHDKNVIVIGKYYPSTGAILVSSVTLAP